MAELSYHSTHHTRKGATTSFGSRTDIGCVREHNEDSLVVKPPLFVVADGMGGHAAGEVASEIAVNEIAAHMPDELDPAALGEAVDAANRSIINAALVNQDKEGMGTTCTAAMLQDDRLIIAQVGDSRAYLLHGGKLQQITRDHSLMANMIEAGQITPEEARVHPNRSVITRALGNDPTTHPDLYEMKVEAGDRLLLCSDGLTGLVSDEDIESIMNRVADPQRCASKLVNEAIAAGGFDNITVIVADVEGKREETVKKVVRKTRATVALIFVLIVAIIAGTAWGASTYLHNTAYLANNDGKVAIYRGVPGEVLGFSYSELVEVTDVSVSDLSVSAQDRINENMRVSSVDEAEDLVNSYRDDIANKKTTSSATSTADSTTSSSSSSSSSSTTASTTARTSGTTATRTTSTGTNS